MSRSKGKPRKITVGGEEYFWIVRSQERILPGFVLVDIFAAANRGKGQHLCVRMRFDDPWYNYGPILTTPVERFDAVWALAPVAPGLVAGWIAEARAAGWDPAARAPAVRRAWLDGRLSADETTSVP